jgi:hypothetical protein
MNRRELLSGMLAFPLLGTVARGIAGPLSCSYRFQDSLEKGLFDALKKGIGLKDLPPWRLLRGVESRRSMAEAMSPLVDRHMREWRREKGVELYLGPLQEVHERASITLEEVYSLSPAEQDAPLLIVARKVWGRIRVIQARETVMHSITEANRHYLGRPSILLPRRHEPVPLRTVVFPEDRPDMRIIGFGVMTVSRDGYRGLGGSAFRFCHFDDLWA